MSERSIILITGASSGFGASTARFFARQGYGVVLAARRAKNLQEITEQIMAEGGEAFAVQTDLKELDNINNLVHETIHRYGKIDVLFNNAGFGRLDWLEKLDPYKDIQAQIDVNVRGLIWMTQAVLPTMIERRQGHIINMASVAGMVATPTYTIYAASKFAVRGFTEALRREVRIHGIHVSAIYPGGANTEFNEVAGIRRRTNVRTPDFMVLSSEQVARAVWKLVQKPRRMMILPWLLRPAAWGNAILPGLYDWAIERLFVVPERSGR